MGIVLALELLDWCLSDTLSCILMGNFMGSALGFLPESCEGNVKTDTSKIYEKSFQFSKICFKK